MESQKMSYRTELSAYSATVADGDDPHPECIPHEKVRETISKIEALKEAHAGVPLFLPAWADDRYFQSMYEERRADKCLFIRPHKAASSTMDEVESEILNKKRVHVQDIDIENVKTFVHEIITKAARRVLHGKVEENVRVQDIDNEKAETFVRGIIEKACRELRREVQENVRVQDIDNEKAKTFVRGIIEKACRELRREVQENVRVQDIDNEKAKTFVRGIIEKACRELRREVQENVRVQDIDNEKVKTYVRGIIEKACRELRREEVFQQFQITIGGNVRRTSNICREKDKSAVYHAIHQLVMKPVLAELIQHTQGKARSFRDSVLNPTTEKDFVARARFLTQSCGSVCDQVSYVRPGPTSAQRVLPQYTFLHTAGIPRGGSSCVDNKQRQRSSWKKRFLTCFGL